MQEYLFLFRMPHQPGATMTADQHKAMMDEWNTWFGGIAAQGKLGNGQQLGQEGKVLKAGGVITDGPFVEIKESLGGYISVKADSLDEATTLAHGCPSIAGGGSVEVRPIMQRM